MWSYNHIIFKLSRYVLTWTDLFLLFQMSVARNGCKGPKWWSNRRKEEDMRDCVQTIPGGVYNRLNGMHKLHIHSFYTSSIIDITSCNNNDFKSGVALLWIFGATFWCTHLVILRIILFIISSFYFTRTLKTFCAFRNMSLLWLWRSSLRLFTRSVASFSSVNAFPYSYTLSTLDDVTFNDSMSRTQIEIVAGVTATWCKG